MHFAFALFNYFPYGGLQRNFLSIANACHQAGHQVTAFTESWDGPRPDWLKLVLIPRKGMTNHACARHFSVRLQQQVKAQHFDALVGFNRMPGLDVYYAADTCFQEKAQDHHRLYRLTSRYRVYADFEQAVYGRASDTEILLVSEKQKPHFQHWYGTPDERFHVLPPGIARDRMAGEEAASLRQAFRQAFGLQKQDRLVLMVGSGFRTKGVDRAIDAVAALSGSLPEPLWLYIVGSDDPAVYQRQAKARGIADRVRFFPGRDDIPRFLQGADGLIHPAYHENTGNVILEAIVAGLPVLATDQCGYAHFIEEAGCGLVHRSPFDSARLAAELETLLFSEKRDTWRNNGIRFGQQHDLYNRPAFAAAVIESVARKKLEKQHEA